MRKIAVLLLAALVTVACGTPNGERGPGRPRTMPASSYEGTWRLTSGVGPGGPVSIVDGYSITLTISGDRAAGRSACNSYGAEIRIEGSRIEFGEGGSTDMDCGDPVLESERAYVAALWKTESISLSRDGKSLSLTGDDVELVYEPVSPPPTEELVGTTWLLESMVEDRGAEASVTGAEPAELRLAADGTFTGSTGCRKLTGEWIEEGDAILFHTMSAHGRCPEDLRSQDNYVVGVLGDGFTAVIEGDRLTVYHVRGHLGLIYRAG